jgi:flagellar biosynthesis protein FlhF
MEDGADLARLIASHPEIDTHLVLPASMKQGDLGHVAERYSIFQPSKVLFTRIDETESLGAIVNIAAQRQLPVSFLACGQQIPDDLEPASKEKIASLVLNRSGHGLISESAEEGNPARELVAVRSAGAAA